MSLCSLSAATRGVPRVALISCRELPALDPDDRLLIDPLEERGVRAEPVAWDDPDLDWSGYALAVLRSPWDYVPQRERFLAWARTVPALANPAATVEWNTDKRYLARLAAAGLPVVSTEWLVPGGPPWSPPPDGEYVLKPSISLGSRDTGRYQLAEPVHRALARRHAERLLAVGRVVMVQPYLSAVDTVGETALMYFDGRFSHAIRKGPLLEGPDRGGIGLFHAEDITPRQASPAELHLAEQVLASVPDGTGLLYARVDVIPGPDGAPVLIELELTEPSLFLGWAPGAAERLADAIVSRITAGSSSETSRSAESSGSVTGG
jgi:hypothetical protein